MADWFETRFREPVDAGRLDPAFAARVRALVVEEWQADAGVTPLDLTDGDESEGDIIMLETEDRPTGNEPPSPRRPRPGRWLLVAAAGALVAVLGGLFVALGGDDEDGLDTVTSTPPTTQAPQPMDLGDEFVELEPGPYYIDPDGDPSTPLRVTYEIAAEGWESWIGAAKFDGGQIGLSITTVTNLVQDACHDHTPAEPQVGPTVDDLATALSQLAPFEVTSPPSDVAILGYQGKHIQLTVPNIPTSSDNFTECTSGELHSWISPNQDGSFFGYNAEPGRFEDFWILDVDGTRLVIETIQSPADDPQIVAELEAIFDSIEIEP